MALLNAESPDIIEAREALGLQILYHPSFSTHGDCNLSDLIDDIEAERTPLDVLCIEGAVILGPDNTGLYETINGTPKKDLISMLAGKTRYLFAVGTCASFGGVTRACNTDAVGLQFTADKRGGFLGESFTTQIGLPVINLPGCPVHPSVILGTANAFLSGNNLELNCYQAPLEYFSMLVHQGCTRNEYHEFQVEEKDFGDVGCLFSYGLPRTISAWPMQ